MMENTAAPRKILIASDHAGFQQKVFLVNKLKAAGLEVLDLGCHSKDSVDFPSFAGELAKSIQNGLAPEGVLICGSGEGMVMAANRFPGIRAGLAWNTEVAALLKQHNNAQIICFGARFTADEYAWLMLQQFLNASFEGGNHARRIHQIG
jgi:ribose 5-phosphate isomerase B